MKQKLFLGNIITMDDKRPFAKAAIVKNGVFSYIGSEEEARKLRAEEFNRLMEGYSIDSIIGPKRPTGRPDPRSRRKG